MQMTPHGGGGTVSRGRNAQKCDRSVAAIADAAAAAILKMFAHSLLMHTQNPYSIHLPFTRVPLAVPLPLFLFHTSVARVADE